MGFQKFKNDSYCFGVRHRSATKNIYGDIASKGSKVLIGYCSICIAKKSMTVTDNTIQAEGLSDFFKNSGKKGLNVSKKWQKTFLKILEELCKMEPTLGLPLQLGARKKLYHHYLK